MSYRPPQRSKAPAAQAKRYRAGRPKDYVSESSESDEEEEQQQEIIRKTNIKEKPNLQFAQKDIKTGIEQVAISEKDVATDRRLQRLQRAQQQTTTTTTSTNDGLRRRRVVESEEESESEEEETVDEDELARQRMKMKQKSLQRVQEEQVDSTNINETQEESEEESEEESSEYETDSESEEEDSFKRMPKPTFVSKKDRVTILQQEKIQREAEEREQKLANEMEKRKEESHNMLAEELKRENEKAVEEDVEEDVDDTDGLDEEAEFEAWKIRELKRIKRDREERIAREKEEEEIERRREMPEEERLKEDLKRAEETRDKDKGEFTYMQKYYHKGAYYQDMDDEIFKRDYSAPTVNEVRNKEILPEIMQVKNFGLQGRTKYTHLAAEDTTDKDSPWAKPLPKRRKHDHDRR